MQRSRHCLAGSHVWLLALFLLCEAAGRGDDAASTPGNAFFESRIRPLLAEHCYKCHSAESEKIKGGLRLDSLSGILKGGESGPAAVPGDPGRSLIVKAVGYED